MMGGVDCGSYDHGCDDGYEDDEEEEDNDSGPSISDLIAQIVAGGLVGDTTLGNLTNNPNPPGDTDPSIDGNLNQVELEFSDLQGYELLSFNQVNTSSGDLTTTAGTDGTDIATGGCPNTTGSPVEFTTGCKLWSESDLELATDQRFDLTRNYKVYFENDFSLGQYWAFPYDSRVILGTTDASLVESHITQYQERYEHYDAVVTEANQLIDEFTAEWAPTVAQKQTLQTSFDAVLENWKTTYRDPAATKRDEYEALQAGAQALLDEINERAAKNQWAAKHAKPTIADISNDRLVWLAPNGVQYAFAENPNDVNRPIAQGHPHRLTRTETGYRV